MNTVAMKKISLFVSFLVLVMISCNKESGNSAGNNPLQVSVTDASAQMQVSYTRFTSNDVLSVQFTEAADSIIWWVNDSAHSGTVHCDSILNKPPGYDSLNPPHADTVYPPPHVPVDSTRFPHDSAGMPPVIPPGDSSRLPGDTIIILPPPSDSVYHPHDSTVNGDSLQYPVSNAFYYSANKTRLTLGIRQSGSYLVSAAAYHKNADGSFTLTKTGYVRLTAH